MDIIWQAENIVCKNDGNKKYYFCPSLRISARMGKVLARLTSL